ncbi:MAG: hypothetical protein LBG77_04480 [Dysgonamonadaceae bacterium]|jgi:hypothetical protein|nr:hypothetical protein [Dysgonamonadaceae bacterium]
MKKLFYFLTLPLLALVFTNCSKENDNSNIVYFYDEPAVVESTGENAVIRSSHDRFIVPALNNTPLEASDLLFTAFVVDTDKKNGDYYQANNFKYLRVDSSKVIIPAGKTEFESYLADDYKAFIDEAVLYPDYLDKLLFFGFRRASSSSNFSFDFEIICNPETESENSYPTLYIRSKKTENATTTASTGRETVFAFDMTDFIDYYKTRVTGKPETNLIGFNLKYKTGTDEDGKDVYRAFRSNPIRWEIKKEK